MGTCEYVIGVVHDRDIWYYVGKYDEHGRELSTKEQYSSFLVDAKRYDDEVELMDDLGNIHLGMTRKILEIQHCPKCEKDFTEHPAISRDDNETEICPKCGIKEAMEAYKEATQ